MKERTAEAWRLSGRVQGVGFRYFVLREARLLGLVGWVANCDDGDVEVHAYGERDALGRFRSVLSAGPPHSKVLAVTSVPASPGLEARDSFTIEYNMA
jgi:acylphosphatase